MLGLVGAATLFTAAIAVLMALFLVGLLVLTGGLIKQTNDEQMQHLDRLPAAAQRRVRRQHWAMRNLPLPLIAGLVGAYVLGFGLMAVASSPESLPWRVFFTPTWIVNQVFSVRLPRLSLYFWAALIAAAVLFARTRKARPWDAPQH